MRKAILLLFILSPFLLHAQNPAIDSLRQVLESYDAKKLEQHQNLLFDEGDTSRVKTILQLGWAYVLVADYNSAKKNVDDALTISQQLGYKKGISNSYHIGGVIYYSQGNFPEALKNYAAALKTREEMGDKEGSAASLNNIGLIYWQQGNNPEALKYYISSLKLWEEISDTNRIADVYNNIGLIYSEQGNYPEALKNYFSSLKIKDEAGDRKGIANSYLNIGTVYSEQGKYDEALKYFSASLKIQQEIGDKYGMAISYTNIGFSDARQGKYSEALENYFASLKISEEIGDKEGIATSYINIGKNKVKANQAGEGKSWLLKAIVLAKEIGAVEMQNAYEGLASADSALGNFEDAYENYKQYVLYRDSLTNEENTKKITQHQMQYEFDKKEAETKAITDAELKKQKLVRNAFVGGFAVVLLFAAIFFRQRNKTQNEKRKSDELLLNILPVEVAAELKNTGRSKAKAFTMVTVMFTDFKDFTTVSEKISAELLVDEIHHCFSAFDSILHKYNIEKIKTIGDAYLCASGLPVSNHTHAADMVSCAMEIRDFMLQRKKEKEAKGEIPFELRIGIHTGPVVAGIVGVKKYAYDIWGDAVNTAARMEQNSESGKINISGSTYELVKHKFRCEYRGKVSAKNKGEIDMYFVEAVS